MKRGFILQYVSDLHLELRKIRNIPIIKPIKEGKTYLALCGDVGNPFLPTYKKFLDIHTDLFAHILIVAGNHEYYTSQKKQRTMRQVDDEIYQIVAEYANVTYLNMDRIIIGRTKFIGCPMWSDVSEIESIAENIMNDYKNIFIDSPGLEERFIHAVYGYRIQKKFIKPNRRRLKASDVSLIHLRMRKWLQTQIDKFDPTDKDRNYDRIIILTHHAPSYQMLDRSDLYSGCYATDCENMMGPPISHWISGHTHVSKEVEINETICLSNCMGYPGQKVEGYELTKYIMFS